MSYEGKLFTLAQARISVAAPELLAALEDAYTRLADVRNQWPDRHTPEGQQLLINMRDAIAKARGIDPESVQTGAGA